MRLRRITIMTIMKLPFLYSTVALWWLLEARPVRLRTRRWAIHSHRRRRKAAQWPGGPAHTSAACSVPGSGWYYNLKERSRCRPAAGAAASESLTQFDVVDNRLGPVPCQTSELLFARSLGEEAISFRRAVTPANGTCVPAAASPRGSGRRSRNGSGGLGPAGCRRGCRAGGARTGFR
jgi:hypothetical protein